jgi:hypothetical protein
MMMTNCTRISLALGVALGFGAAAAASDDAFVARVYYDDVMALSNVVAHYDAHEYNNFDEKYIRVTVSSSQYARLAAEGWQVAYDAEGMAAIDASGVVFGPRGARSRRRVPFSFYGAYKTVDEIYADLCATTAQFPAITQLRDYGDGYCKAVGGAVTPDGVTQEVYDLVAVKVTNPQVTCEKPVFFLMAGIHAREITTPEVALRFLQWLVDGYGVDPDATWLVDWTEIWIVPVANPEGHWIVELGAETAPSFQPYTQRKNAHRNGCLRWPPAEWGQYGVDLNRNHSYRWNNGGSSGLECDLTYRGTAAASEPETAALEQLLTDVFSGACTTADAPQASTNGIFISLHSYGRLVLWAWGYTQTQPPHSKGLSALGGRLAAFNGYTPNQAVNLYPTSGDSVDFVYGALGVPAFTFELGSTFFPTYADIDTKQWPRNKPALIHAAKLAAAPYDTVYGPDVTELTVSFISNGNAIVTAVVDDSSTGGAAIEGAELYIGAPPWRQGTTGLPMTAVDGKYDGYVETMRVEVAVGLLPQSNTVVLARGVDATGVWGPPSGAFLDAVPEPAGLLVLVLLLLRRK